MGVMWRGLGSQLAPGSVLEILWSPNGSKMSPERSQKIFKTVAKEGWQKILNFARSQQTEGRTMISNVHFFEKSFLLLLETVDVTRINK